MSGWAGPRYERNDSAPPLPFPWDAAVGEPSKLSWWPQPGTRRVPGTMRWPCDDLLRPHHCRRWGWIGYVTAAEYNLSWKFREHFWIDLFEVEPFVLLGSTPFSSYGSRVTMELSYLDEISGPGSGGGVASRIWVNADGQGDRLFEEAFPNDVYNFAGPTDGRPVTLPLAQPPQANVPWQHCWAWYRPMSQCYPVDSLTLPDQVEGLTMNDFVGVVAEILPNQSLTGGVQLDLGNPFRNVGGDWWSDSPPRLSNEIVVPAPWNHVQIKGHLNTGNSIVNALAFYAQVNGTYPQGFRLLDQHGTLSSGSTSDMEFESPIWLPVSPGNVITFHASQTNGVSRNLANASWIEVRGAYLAT